MDYLPLGGYEQLLHSGPRPWSAGTVVHGSGVLDDLIAGIERHRDTCAEGYSHRLGPTAAAIGCVPWLTDGSVADALISLGQCCIIVDKQPRDYRAVQRLAQDGHPLSSGYLDGFGDMAVPDERGDPPVIHPFSGRLDPIELGPVRVAGWRVAGDRSPRPMLHSKLLVLGVTTYYEDDEELAGDILKFEPKATWMGSANWSLNARNNIEYGLWSTEPQLVRANYEYLLSVINFSEAHGASTVGPEPELVPARWNAEAFRQYFAENPHPDIDPSDE